MSGLNYLLQTNLYLILFIGFYQLVLRNETFFKQNRFYLNTSIFLSFAIPFINSSWFKELFVTQKVREVFVSNQMMQETIIVDTNNDNGVLTTGNILQWVYIGITTILLIRFLIKLLQLRSSFKPKQGAALSFFNKMVVDKELPESAIIIDHEKVHMKEWHSADIILIELASIINWFNPVVYLYKKEIRHIHEFIADEETASMMNSKSDYAMLLFSNTLGVQPNYLINNFFNKSLLKRRVIMLNKTKSRKVGLWKYGFSAPLFILMLIVSAATMSSERNILNIDRKVNIDPFYETSSLDLLPHTSKNKEEPKAITSNSVADDGNALKKHIEKNIKYPDAAKQNEITGYVMVSFTVFNNRITKTVITKGLQGDIDADILRVFSLFTDPIHLENKDYSLAIYYQLTGVHNADILPATTNTYLGRIIVTAIGAQENRASNYALGEVVVDDSAEKSIKDFTTVETLPEFNGGMSGWTEYLTKNLKYPDHAKKQLIQGRVILSFVVLKDGSITDIKVLRGLGSGLDEEAVRVVAQSPKWKPGISGGQPVNVAYTMPIFFQLGQQTRANILTVISPPALPADVKDFASVEFLPEFAGGIAGWGKYLQANLKYPDEAKKANITGRVIISFIVEKDGSLSEIKVLRGIGGGCDEEAVRVLKTSPNWKAGIQEGRPVRVAYTMPIFFQLAAKATEEKTN